MTTDLQTIRQRVSRKIQDPDNTAISASVVDSEINRAVRYYQNYRFWFNEDMATITLTANTQVVPSVPADVTTELQVNGLMIIDEQVKINLIKLAPDEFFNRDQEQTGRPYFYTYRDYEYLLLPIPDIAYPLKFRYTKNYADLVNNTDTNDFTNFAPDLIMMHAIKNLYAEDKQDPQSAVYYNELERNEFNALMKRSSDRNGTGFLSVNTILDTNYF